MAAILQDYPRRPPSRYILQDRDEVIMAIEDMNDPVLSAAEIIAMDLTPRKPSNVGMILSQAGPKVPRQGVC